MRRAGTINGKSCGGNSNVLRELGRRPLWDAAPHLIAVLDSDKLHDLLGGAARNLVDDHGYAAWTAQMQEKCRDRLGAHERARLTIAFLDRNLESLQRVLGDATGAKDVVQRDRLLQRASADPVQIRRASTELPTWAALVDAVAGRLGEP